MNVKTWHKPFTRLMITISVQLIALKQNKPLHTLQKIIRTVNQRRK